MLNGVMEKKVVLIFYGLEITVLQKFTKTVRERTFNILNISENIAPESFKISEDGKLEVKWNEDKHISYYEPSWLRKNCYTIKRKKSLCFALYFMGQDIKFQNV